MAGKRVSNIITKKEDLDFLLNITDKSITRTFIMECFGEFDGKRRFNPYDQITIPAGYYGTNKKKNKNSFKTTVGIWIYNKYFIEPDFVDIFGYITKKLIRK